MNFIADKQTLDDLGLLDRYSSSSIFFLFNRVKTKGGEMLLDKMFRNPLTDVEAINQRSDLFKHFQSLNLTFPLEEQEFMEMDLFIRSSAHNNWFAAALSTLRITSLKLIGVDEEYNLLLRGLHASLNCLNRFYDFFDNLLILNPETPLKEQAFEFMSLYSKNEIEKLKIISPPFRVAITTLAKYDYVFGVKLHEAMLGLLSLIYEIDVYIAVSSTAFLNRFIYATAMPSDQETLSIKDCRYPTLKNAKGNDINIDEQKNMLFITGANMAGKSTLMKAIGVNVFLAHMGFPVAADKMEFSIRDGMFSSINLPDNITQGYSHFYAEVLRVKTVAEEVSRQKNLLVIFDELFKGTNVKDAFDATLAITAAFSDYHNCAFIISTHIVEVADELMKSHNNMQFSKMPTIMNGKIPTYTYKLQEGISSDKHGMMIIENEGIMELLK